MGVDTLVITYASALNRGQKVNPHTHLEVIEGLIYKYCPLCNTNRTDLRQYLLWMREMVESGKVEFSSSSPV